MRDFASWSWAKSGRKGELMQRSASNVVQAKEVKSRKITVSTGTLAALDTDAVQGHLSGTPSSNLTHSYVFLVGLVS